MRQEAAKLAGRGADNRSDPLCALVYAVLKAGGVKTVFVPEIGFHHIEETAL